MRHWQGLALVAVSVFGLTACGGKKESAQKQTTDYSACTVTVDGKLCANSEKSGCTTELYGSLKKKIESLPATLNTCPLREVKSADAALASATDDRPVNQLFGSVLAKKLGPTDDEIRAAKKFLVFTNDKANLFEFLTVLQGTILLLYFFSM